MSVASKLRAYWGGAICADAHLRDVILPPEVYQRASALYERHDLFPRHHYSPGLSSAIALYEYLQRSDNPRNSFDVWLDEVLPALADKVEHLTYICLALGCVTNTELPISDLAISLGRTAQLSSELPTMIAGFTGLLRLAMHSVPVERYLYELSMMLSEADMPALWLNRVGHAVAWGSQERALKHLAQQPSTDAMLAQVVYICVRYPGELSRILDNLPPSPPVATLVAGAVGAAQSVE